MMSINDFSVVLTGASSATRRTAALLINQALRERGFQHIDVLDNHGEPLELPECVPSVLDTIRKNAPRFLDSMVTIQEVKVRTYDQSYSEEDTPYAMG